MRNIYDLTIKELEDYFISINEKKFMLSGESNIKWDKFINEDEENSPKLPNYIKDALEWLKVELGFNQGEE